MFGIGFLDIEQWAAEFMLPFFRVASFFMVVPVIGTRMVPARIRMGLALAVTAVIVPVLPDLPQINGLSLQTYLWIAEQILIGVAMGFLLQILFQVYALGGQLIASQMGLGFASVSDPANGVSVVVLSQFYLMIVMMLFLALNGHLVLIEVLVRSFDVLPVTEGGISSSGMMAIAMSGSWLVSSALLMSLPAVTALLVINFAFGIMTKAAPQLNIFAVGFPFTMLMGLLITWVSLEGFLGQYYRFTEFAFQYLERVIGMGL